MNSRQGMTVLLLTESIKQHFNVLTVAAAPTPISMFTRNLLVRVSAFGGQSLANIEIGRRGWGAVVQFGGCLTLDSPRRRSQDY